MMIRFLTSIFKNISLLDLVIISVVFALCIGQITDIADDPGIGWHLATGDLILSGQGIPQTDPFLHTVHTRPWVANQWGSDVVIEMLFRLAGWPLLYCATLLLFLWSYLYLLPLLTGSVCNAYLASIAVAILAFKTAQVHLVVRPTVVSFTLFLIIYVLCLLKGGAKPPLSRRLQTILIGTLFVLWANLHPAFLLGLLILFMRFISASLSDRKIELQSLFPFVVALLATLVNPYFLNLHASALQLLGSRYFMSLNAEWQPLTIASFEGMLFVVLCCLGIAGLLQSRVSIVRQKLFIYCTFLLFVVLSARSVRLLPYFAIVSALPAVEGLSRIMSRFGRLLSPRLRTLLTLLEEREGRSKHGFIAIVIVSLAMGLGAGMFNHIPGYQGEYGPQKSRYPFKALDWLVQQGEVGDNRETQVVLSHPDWGGFITFIGSRSGKKMALQAVIDDRNELVGETFYRDLFSALVPEAGVAKRLDRYQADYLLLPSDSKLGAYLIQSGELPVLHRDEVALLFGLNEILEQ